MKSFEEQRDEYLSRPFNLKSRQGFIWDKFGTDKGNQIYCRYQQTKCKLNHFAPLILFLFFVTFVLCLYFINPFAPLALLAFVSIVSSLFNRRWHR